MFFLNVSKELILILRRKKYLPIFCIMKIVAKKANRCNFDKINNMKKLHLFTVILLAIFQFKCKKITLCNVDICSSKQTTKQTVTNQGVMGISIINNDRRWMINVLNDLSAIIGTTCII